MKKVINVEYGSEIDDIVPEAFRVFFSSGNI